MIADLARGDGAWYDADMPLDRTAIAPTWAKRPQNHSYRTRGTKRGFSRLPEHMMNIPKPKPTTYPKGTAR